MVALICFTLMAQEIQFEWRNPTPLGIDVDSICFAPGNITVINAKHVFDSHVDLDTSTHYLGETGSDQGSFEQMLCLDSLSQFVAYTGTDLYAGSNPLALTLSAQFNGEIGGLGVSTDLLVIAWWDGSQHVSSSTDLVDWQDVILPASQSVTKVSFENNTFVAFAETIYASTDGLNWDPKSASGIRDVTYAQNGLYYGVTTNAVRESADLNSWTQVFYQSGASFRRVTFELGHLFVCGSTNSFTGFASASDDGEHWTQVLDATDIGHVNGFALRPDDGVLVAFGEEGFLSYTADGSTWTEWEESLRHHINDIDIVGSTYYLSTDLGLYKTEDFALFVPLKTGQIVLEYERNENVAVITALYSLNSGSWYLYSAPTSNETDWTEREVDPNYTNEFLDYANGIFFAGAGTGTWGMYRSADGITWNTTLTETHVTGVSYSNGVYVAGTTSGIFTSVNGVSWTLACDTDDAQKNLLVSETGAVRVFSSSHLWATEDCILWTEYEFSPAFLDLPQYLADYYVANSGDLVSEDGVIWRNSGLAYPFDVPFGTVKELPNGHYLNAQNENVYEFSVSFVPAWAELHGQILVGWRTTLTMLDLVRYVNENPYPPPLTSASAK